MGTSTERFQVQRSLGKGGIGEAFLAAETSSGRLGVLKKVPVTAFAKKIESLKKEFATLNRLAHPNIARVFEFGSDGEAVFFFEEYVDGRDLFESTRGADYNQILSCLAQILRALHYLHTQGFLHGDLKPENILAVRGVPIFREDAVKLIDFGLASHLGDLRPNQRPSGTIHFMAPEMLTGKGYDARADLFALGVCLYRMLAGRYPFEEERGDMSRLIEAQLKKTPPEPKSFRADLSQGLNDVILRLMSKSPEDRYPDAQKVLQALNEAEGERFLLWTPAELKTTLHDGPFIGRERELKALKGLYDGGRRDFSIAGPEGIGKSRIIQEFKTRLQLEGKETEGLLFREEIVPSEGSVSVAPWDREETALFLRDRLRIPEAPPRLLEAACVAGGVPLRLITLIDFWLADGGVSIDGGRALVDLSKIDPALGFEEILGRKLAALEVKKRHLLFLCAFSRTPLSAHLLQRITGETARDTEAMLDALEREGWLVRELDEGGQGFRTEGLRREELLRTLTEASSFSELLALVRETYRSGDLRRARSHLDELISRFPGEVEGSPRSVQRDFYETASLVLLETDDLERARAFTQLLLQLPDLTDVERGKGLNRFGWIAYRRGLYEEAQGIFRAAEAVWEASGDLRGRVSAANFLGMVDQARKDFDPALRHYRRALALLPDGDEWLAMIRMNLALCAHEAEGYGEALEAYERALKESEGGKDKHVRATILANLSNLYLYLGRLDRAGALAHASLKFAIENGLEGLEGQNYLFLAHLADKEGNLRDFQSYVEKAKTVFSRRGTVAEKARAALYEAFFALTAGDDARCRAVIARLRSEFPGEPGVMAQCDVVEGKLALKADPPDASHGAPPLERARAYYEGRRDEANLWEVLNSLGQLHRLDRPDQARDYLRRTLEILDRVSEKIPEPMRAAFYRDRKREKILETLNQLNPKAVTTNEGRPHHAERRTP
jgi:tetratricopeptide (TPR) repeat protein/predicted Ser/Thr protein kinase